MIRSLTATEREVWDLDVSECADCAEMGGEDLCAEHDLDDPDVVARYLGAEGSASPEAAR